MNMKMNCGEASAFTIAALTRTCYACDCVACVAREHSAAVGMISYSAKCAEQLMALEGSPMGESLRKAIASQTGDGAAKRGASSQRVLSIACASGGVHLLNLLTCFSGRYSPRLPSSALIVILFLHHVSTLSSSQITTESARCSAQALHRIAHHIAPR